MRSTSSLPSVAVVASTAVVLVALVLLSPKSVFANTDTPPSSDTPAAQAPASPAVQESPPVTPLVQPRWFAPQSRAVVFDDYDQIAALDAVRIALAEVGDGATYVWHRGNGKFSGTAKPTLSFKNRNGQPCRHIVVTLQTRSHSRTTEGVACRLSNGRWQLDG